MRVPVLINSICRCRGEQWPNLNTSWITFRQGFDSCTAGGGRPIVMSVESCGTDNSQDCQAWVPALANLWRTTGDIQATWGSVLGNLDGNNPLAHIAGPGHWNGERMAWSLLHRHRLLYLSNAKTFSAFPLKWSTIKCVVIALLQTLTCSK